MASKKQHTTIVSVPVPPPDPRPYVAHITLPQARETSFLAIHPKVLGFPMHWLGNQPDPHRRDREWCAGCKLGQSPRWEGYLGVISLKTLNRFVLKIPMAAFRESGLFRERSDAHGLVGTIFTAWRFGQGTGKNRPAVIEIESGHPPAPKIHPFPLTAALARYWRMENLDVVEEISRPEDMAKKTTEQWISFAERLKAKKAAEQGGGT